MLIFLIRLAWHILIGNYYPPGYEHFLVVPKVKKPIILPGQIYLVPGTTSGGDLNYALVIKVYPNKVYYKRCTTYNGKRAWATEVTAFDRDDFSAATTLLDTTEKIDPDMLSAMKEVNKLNP